MVLLRIFRPVNFVCFESIFSTPDGDILQPVVMGPGAHNLHRLPQHRVHLHLDRLDADPNVGSRRAGTGRLCDLVRVSNENQKGASSVS